MQEKFETIDRANSIESELAHELEIAEELRLEKEAYNDMAKALGVNGDEELQEQQIREAPIKRYGVTEPVAENFFDLDSTEKEGELFVHEPPFRNKTNTESVSKSELEYSVKDLSFMQECARYNDRLSVELKSKIKEHRPVRSDGKPLTDQEVSEQVKKYQEYQNKKKKNIPDMTPYNKEDKDMMIKCSAWFGFYKPISEVQPTPVGTDGLPMKNKEIAEVAHQYYKFRNENPEQFAELKYKKGEWGRGIFRWEKEEFNGKKQWASVVPSVVADEQGNRKEIETKYILTEEPIGIDKDGAYYYFSVKNRTTSRADGTNLVFIDLKYPLVKERKNIQTAQAKKVA